MVVYYELCPVNLTTAVPLYSLLTMFKRVLNLTNLCLAKPRYCVTLPLSLAIYRLRMVTVGSLCWNMLTAGCIFGKIITRQHLWHKTFVLCTCGVQFYMKSVTEKMEKLYWQSAKWEGRQCINSQFQWLQRWKIAPSPVQHVVRDGKCTWHSPADTGTDSYPHSSCWH